MRWNGTKNFKTKSLLRLNFVVFHYLLLLMNSKIYRKISVSFRAGSKFVNFGLGNGESWKSQYHRKFLKSSISKDNEIQQKQAFGFYKTLYHFISFNTEIFCSARILQLPLASNFNLNKNRFIVLKTKALLDKQNLN